MISYEVAVNKAFYRIISKAKYGHDILQYLDEYDRLKDSARRIDEKNKYGKNSRSLFYVKSYLLAVMMTFY